MLFLRARSALVLMTGAVLFSQSGLTAAMSSEEQSLLRSSVPTMSLVKGQSIGEPVSLDLAVLENSGPFAKLRTKVDLANQNVDFSQWSDDQIEEFYRDSVNTTNRLLDEVARNPRLADAIGNYLVAEADAGASKPDDKSQMTSMSCMAAAIQGEAGAESMEGKLLVGETVMARAGGQAEKVCAVIFARAQFESMTKRVKAVNADSLKAAKMTLEKPAGQCGYDHFINKKLQRKLGRKIPKWVRNFEKWGCTTKEEGGHTFYKSCECKNKKK
jgi:hypothetical protein